MLFLKLKTHISILKILFVFGAQKLVRSFCFCGWEESMSHLTDGIFSLHSYRLPCFHFQSPLLWGYLLSVLFCLFLSLLLRCRDSNPYSFLLLFLPLVFLALFYVLSFSIYLLPLSLICEHFCGLQYLWALEEVGQGIGSNYISRRDLWSQSFLANFLSDIDRL